MNQQEPQSQRDAQAQPVDDSLELHSARAMAATYVQIVRHAELAQALHTARLRATSRRLKQARDPREAERLQRALEAQQNQGLSIDSAVDRLRRRADNVSAFKEAGLTQEDFESLGLDRLFQSPPVAQAAAADTDTETVTELNGPESADPAQIAVGSDDPS